MKQFPKDLQFIHFSMFEFKAFFCYLFLKYLNKTMGVFLAVALYLSYFGRLVA